MAETSESGTAAFIDEHSSPGQQWKWSFVAAMAGYIDAGSIVAGSIGLNTWTEKFHMGGSLVSMLGAFSSNAISAGVGALVGGWVCDRYGRKKIYAYDLLVYMFGLLFIIFALNSAMLFVGYVIMGLAVGADIPASWSLITEFSPTRKRGKLGSLSQVLWNVGPVVTAGLGVALMPLGLLGVRLLFVHLLVIGAVTWVMRHGVGESARWQRARDDRLRAKAGAGGGTGAPAGAQPATAGAGRTLRDDLRELFSPRGLKPLLILVGTYGLWNLMAGTNGFYQPYLLKTLGAQSDAASNALQCLSFGLTVLGTLIVFMPLSDRMDRRVLFAASIVIQIAGYALLMTTHMTTGVAVAYIVLLGFGGGFSAQHFFQLWSGEVFPTRLRSTAQGVMFAVVRIGLGVWSFFVTDIQSSGYRTLAVILSSFLLASGIVGVVWAPRTRGKTLEEIEVDYGWAEGASTGRSGDVAAAPR